MDIDKIYKEYFETVYKYLLYLTHNEDLSEELTQETFFKAIKNMSSFKENCHISTWLIQIAKNLLDEIHKQVVFLRISGELSFKEIGLLLNQTENWARVTFYRAKNKLMKGVDCYDK